MPAHEMTAITCTSCQHAYVESALFCPNCGRPKARSAGNDALIGKLLGDRFQVIDMIGQGGSGTIYRAEHVTLRRKVAVKILHDELSRDDLAVERFRREATTVAEIDNEHIVEIHDFGRTPDGRLYLAMELLEGETLDTVLAREKQLSYERAADILIQVGEALMEAHAIGYVHRDLRPRNLYLANRRGKTNFVKLLDFGLAKLVDTDSQAASTSVGMTFGDPRYMSPEAARGDRIDRRADIYQLGCICYEMLTGAPPFTGNRVFDILTKQVSEIPQPLPTRRPGVPLWMEAAAAKMLAKDPENRFATTTRMVDALRRGLETGEVMEDEVARRRESVPPPSVSRVMQKMGITPDGGVQALQAANPTTTAKGLPPLSAAIAASTAQAQAQAEAQAQAAQAQAAQAQAAQAQAAQAQAAQAQVAQAAQVQAAQAQAAQVQAAQAQAAQAQAAQAAAAQAAAAQAQAAQAAATQAAAQAAAAQAAAARAQASQVAHAQAAHAQAQAAAAQAAAAQATAVAQAATAAAAAHAHAPAASAALTTPNAPAPKQDSVELVRKRTGTPQLGVPVSSTEHASSASGTIDPESGPVVTPPMPKTQARVKSPTGPARTKRPTAEPGISQSWYDEGDDDAADSDRPRKKFHSPSTTDSLYDDVPRGSRKGIVFAVIGVAIVIGGVAFALTRGGGDEPKKPLDPITQPALAEIDAGESTIITPDQPDAGVAVTPDAAVATNTRPNTGSRPSNPGIDLRPVGPTPSGPIDVGAFVLGGDRNPQPPVTPPGPTPGTGSGTTVVIIPGPQPPTPGTGSNAGSDSGLNGGPVDPYGNDGPGPDAPGNPEQLATQGQQQLNNGDATNAAISFKKALELDPNNATATIGMGDIASRQGLWAAALGHLNKAAKLAPKNAYVFVLLGEAHLRSGNPKEATIHFKKALTLDPNSARARDGFNEASAKTPPPTDEE